MSKKRLSSAFLTLTTLVAILLVATPAFAEGHGGEHEIHVVYLVGVVINFLIFVFLLGKLAIPAMNKKYADQRRELVEHLDSAKKLREMAEDKLAEYQTRLDGLEHERQEILDRYHVQGETERDRLIADAKNQIEKMKINAATLIEQEQRRAIKDLEQEAVDLAVKLAEEKLVVQVSEETDARMIDQLSQILKSEAA